MSDTQDNIQAQRLNVLKCDEDDIICFGDQNIYKIAKLRAAVYNRDTHYNYRGMSGLILQGLSEKGVKIDPEIIREPGKSEDSINLVQEINCSILQQSGGGWKKGKFKMKITLEICENEENPEESESPLDDIRRSLSENGS